MENPNLLHPTLIGRREELCKLQEALSGVAAGKGSTILVSGEAGIGKTRLVSETLEFAEKNGTLLLRGWCLPENLEPMSPVKEALRSGGIQDMLAGAPPPRLLSAFLINDAGMLFAKAERVRSDMDGDIFAAMLKAVSNFLGDSLEMMGEGSGFGGFSTISHGDHRIMVQSRGRFSLAAVAEGPENEFLIDDMKKLLTDVEPGLDPCSIDMSSYTWVEERLMKFVKSPKYDGNFMTDDARLRQENLFDNVLLGLQRISVTRPVIIFLDDLQWADTSTLAMVHYLARNTRNSRIFLLGTYRPEDVMKQADGRPHPLETAMQDMSRESLFSDIRLRRLDRQGTSDVISGALGASDLPGELGKRIHDETEGNPFFVLEVLRLLVDEKYLGKEGELWKLQQPLNELHLPGKILDVVQRRLNRLLKEQYEILEYASVVGERFGSDVLGQSIGMGRIPLLKNLNEIEKVHMLIHARDSKYHFDHCKIRDVLYDGISDELRVEYHRLVGHSYEHLFQGREAEVAGDIAYHFVEAGDKRASKYLIIAADKAKEGYANEEAIRFYNLALGHVTDYPERGRILECLADLYHIVGEYDRAVQMCENAIGISNDAIVKAELFRKMSRTLERHSEYEKSISAAERGLELLGDSDAPVRNKLMAAKAWCHIRQGEYDSALELQEKSLAIAERLGYEKEAADAHHLTGTIWWLRGNYEKALVHYQKALAMQRKTGDDRGKQNTINNIGVVYMEIGRLDEAHEFFLEGLEYEEMLGDKSGMAVNLDNIGNLLHSRGEVHRALEYHLKGLELYKMTGDKNGIAWSLSSLGYVYPDMGEYGKGIDSFLESAEICKEIGDQHILTYDYYGLADKYAEMGELEKAREYVNKAMELATELGAMREQGASAYVLGIIQREEGNLSKAMETFGSAKAILAEVGDTYLEAAIDYDAGLCLGRMDKKEEARASLERARAHFESSGMKRWLVKVDKALAEIDQP
jgi:tetratricopeptide (TPR) repeat protein